MNDNYDEAGESASKLVSYTATLNGLLKESNMLSGQLSRASATRLVGMNNILAKQAAGNVLSRHQLGYLSGAEKFIKADITAQRQVNTYRSVANDLLKENNGLYKKLSDRQKAVYQIAQQELLNADATVSQKQAAAKAQVEILQAAKRTAEAEEKMKDLLDDYSSELDEIRANWKKFGMQVDATFRSPQAAAGVAIGVIVSKLREAYKAAVDMRQELGLSATQFANASKTTAMAAASTQQWGGDVEQATKAYAAIADETGNINRASREAVATNIKFANIAGMTNSEIAAIQMTFAEMPGATEAFSEDMMEMARQMAIANNVPLNKVMKDIASSSELFALHGKDGAENLIQASVMATKLGVSLNAISKAGEAMLNIESSLASEMEASVLIGREMNLDKARQAALAGDQATVQREIIKNAGSIEDFNKMDIIQKQALADAVGLQMNDLTKIINNQEEMGEIQTGSLAFWKKQTDSTSEAADSAMLMTESLKTQDAMLAIATASLIFQGALWLKNTMLSRGMMTGLTNLGSKILPGISSKLQAFGSKMRGGAAVQPVTPAKTATPSVKGGGGGSSSKSLTDLAKGLQAMGNAKVLFGAFNLIPASIGLVAMLPGLPTLLILGTVKMVSLYKNMSALARGLTQLGTGAVALGALNMILSAIGFVLFIPALPVLALLAIPGFGKLIGMGLAGLAQGIGKMGTGNVLKGALGLFLIGLALIPAAFAFSLLKDVPVLNMIAFALAVPLLGLAFALLGYLIVPIALGAVSVLTMGLALIVFGFALSFVKALPTEMLIGIATTLPVLGAGFAILGFLSPFIMLGSLALMTLGFALAIFGYTLANFSGGFTQLSPMIQSLSILATLGPGLSLAAISIMGLAMSTAALAVSLYALIPALAIAKALGVDITGALGGGTVASTTTTETSATSNEQIVAKLDELIIAVREGAVVEIDGNQVGKAVVKFVNLKSGSTAAGQKLIKI